jgi:hypothetical protein
MFSIGVPAGAKVVMVSMRAFKEIRLSIRLGLTDYIVNITRIFDNSKFFEKIMGLFYGIF